MRNRILLLFQPEARHFAFPGDLLRKTLLFGLFTLLVLTGLFTDHIFLFLNKLYHYIFISLGLFSFLNKSQVEVSSLVTMRSWSTMITYVLLYSALSFLFLHLYFNRSWKSLIVAGFYFFIIMACTMLILTGKLLPDAEWAYKLCLHLMEMLVSPLPVILLIAAMARAKF
jgi:hypothetical protein